MGSIHSGNGTKNQLTTASYDANGNTISSGGNTFGYTAENKLKLQQSAAWPLPWTLYGSDPGGHRVMKETNPDPYNNNGQDNPLWEFYFYTLGGQKLVTIDCNNANTQYQPSCWVVGENVYFGGRLLASNGAYVATDRLGTVRANTQGEKFNYYPYGEERSSTVDGREKFGTYFRDGVGQDYAEQRYYNSGMGRFGSPDPGGIKTVSPRRPGSWNRYSYVEGDPVNFIDPAGTSLVAVGMVCIGYEVPVCSTGNVMTGAVGPEYPVSVPEGGGGPANNKWGKALAVIGLATEFVIADLAPGSISSDCQGDIDALGKASTEYGAEAINNETLAGAVAGANYQNGLTATAPLSSLNDPTIAAQYMNLPISTQLGGTSTINGESQLGGNTIYFDPNWIISNSVLYDAGLLMHEALHNLGLNDPQAEGALGLTSTQCGTGTDCINIKLQNDCLPPPAPTVLGGNG